MRRLLQTHAAQQLSKAGHHSGQKQRQLLGTVKALSPILATNNNNEPMKKNTHLLTPIDTHSLSQTWETEKKRKEKKNNKGEKKDSSYIPAPQDH